MLNFLFQNPTRILFGKGRFEELGREISKDKKVLITFGGGSAKKTGTLDEVKAALKGFQLVEFGGIEPNPTYETLMKAVQVVREQKIDFLLAVGGGSVIDGTKFIAAAALYQGEPWEILQTFGKKITQALPFGCVLTMPATGSEMNDGSVISKSATKDKLFFTHPLVYPRFAFLDPTRTFSLPPRQVSNGVIDAFVHVMEQYLTFPVNGKIQDRFSEGLLLTLIEEGPKALSDPTNEDVRANIMWCTSLALNGLIGAGVPQDWTTHMIGHEITAQYGLDHAQTLAIVLPATLAVRRQAKREKLLQYASRVWDLNKDDEESRMTQAIDKTRAFFEKMQMKTHLKDYGIRAECIPILLAQLEKHGMVKLGEREDVTLDISHKILDLCL